ARRTSDTRAAAGCATEQLVEQATQILGFEVEVGRVATVRARRPRIAAASPGPTAEVDARRLSLLDLLPVMPPTVVLLALFGIRQDRVGLADLLERRFGLLVAGVDVRMVFARQLAIGAL